MRKKNSSVKLDRLSEIIHNVKGKVTKIPISTQQFHSQTKLKKGQISCRKNPHFLPNPNSNNQKTPDQ